MNRHIVQIYNRFVMYGKRDGTWYSSGECDVLLHQSASRAVKRDVNQSKHWTVAFGVSIIIACDVYVIVKMYIAVEMHQKS